MKQLCVDGRNVFMGYLNMPEQTAEALDANGLLHTGDLAKIDADGFLYITGNTLYSYFLNYSSFEKLLKSIVNIIHVNNDSSIFKCLLSLTCRELVFS